MDLISRSCTINFYDVFWYVNELIDESLAVDLGEDSTLIIIAEGTTHGLVVHVWLVLVEAPESRDGFAVDQLEDASFSIRPLDIARAVFSILE